MLYMSKLTLKNRYTSHLIAVKIFNFHKADGKDMMKADKMYIQNYYIPEIVEMVYKKFFLVLVLVQFLLIKTVSI